MVRLPNIKCAMMDSFNSVSGEQGLYVSPGSSTDKHRAAGATPPIMQFAMSRKAVCPPVSCTSVATGAASNRTHFTGRSVKRYGESTTSDSGASALARARGAGAAAVATASQVSGEAFPGVVRSSTGHNASELFNQRTRHHHRRFLQLCGKLPPPRKVPQPLPLSEMTSGASLGPAPLPYHRSLLKDDDSANKMNYMASIDGSVSVPASPRHTVPTPPPQLNLTPLNGLTVANIVEGDAAPAMPYGAGTCGLREKQRLREKQGRRGRRGNEAAHRRRHDENVDASKPCRSFIRNVPTDEKHNSTLNGTAHGSQPTKLPPIKSKYTALALASGRSPQNACKMSVNTKQVLFGKAPRSYTHNFPSGGVLDMFCYFSTHRSNPVYYEKHLGSGKDGAAHLSNCSRNESSFLFSASVADSGYFDGLVAASVANSSFYSEQPQLPQRLFKSKKAEVSRSFGVSQRGVGKLDATLLFDAQQAQELPIQTPS